jgi:lysophospholipase L1-like esterase
MSAPRRLARARVVAGQVGPVLAAVVLAAATPAARVQGIRQGFDARPAMTGLVAAAAALVMVAVRHRRGVLTRRAIAAIAVVAGLGAAALGGRHLGPWVVATVWFAAWAALDGPLPIRWSRRVDRQVLVVVVVLHLQSARALRQFSGGLRPGLAYLAVAGVVAVVLGPHGDRFAAAGRSIGAGVGRVLPMVLLAPIWVLLALLPWVLDRLARFDPLRPGSRGSTWLPRADDRDRPDRAWFPDPARDRPPFARRLHARARGVLTFLVLAGVASAWVVLSQQPPARPGQGPNLAERLLHAEPTYADAYRGTDDVLNEGRFSQYVGSDLTDHRSPVVNVSGGRRRTIRPPACAARRVKVWMFGGSTLFGVSQPDTGTIPSALVREAARHHVPLEISNWGVPGDVTWQESRRLERALAGGTAPDVVVFYGGWNDYQIVADTDRTGRGGKVDFVGPMDNLQERVLSQLGGLQRGQWRWFRVPDPAYDVGPLAAADLGARQYRVANETARLLAEAHGARFISLYQPALYTRRHRVPGEPAGNDQRRPGIRAFRAHLPAGVVDLSRVFDDVKSPLFVDEVHTRTVANPILARAIYPAIEPAVAKLADERRSAPCR